MALEISPELYVPLHGEEFKKHILHIVEQQLSDDTRFKQSVVYHDPQPTVVIRWVARNMPEDEVIVRGNPQLKTWMEEVKLLRDKLEMAGKRWHEEVAKIEKPYADKQKQLEEENKTLQARVEQLEAQLRYNADRARKVEVPSGYQSFEVEIEGEKVEQPALVRQSLEAPAEVEVAGRAPEELVNVGTDGHPVPAPQPANTGAVVGGGQRPSNVVGRPK